MLLNVIKVIEERKKEFAEGKMDSDEDSINTADNDDVSFTRRKIAPFYLFNLVMNDI